MLNFVIGVSPGLFSSGTVFYLPEPLSLRLSIPDILHRHRQTNTHTHCHGVSVLLL